MELAAVERWALAHGVDGGWLREARDEAMLVAVGRLLQAANSEGTPGSSRFRRVRGRTWLISGDEPSLWLPIRGPLIWGRFEADGPPRLVVGGSEERILREPQEFLRSLARAWPELNDLSFERLKSDFCISLANLLLNRVLAQLAAPGVAPPEPALDGNHNHPFPALRVGPGIEEVAACSLLSRTPVRVPLFRVKGRRFTSVHHSERELLPRWAGRKIEVGGVLPVHPWQLELSPTVQAARSLGILDPLDEEVHAFPLASQRTCRVAASLYDLKLSIDVTLTGEKRLLFPGNALNAPVVSALARQLLEAEGPGALGLQCDVATISHEDPEIGTHLAAIVREPLPIPRRGRIVPAVLLWNSPNAAASVLRLDRENIEETFRSYCRIVMRGPIEFHARWGLSLEPHLQNSMIRVCDGLPVGLVLRDLDGTILDSSRVPRMLREARLALPGQHWDEMPSARDGGRRLLNAMLYGHLGQVTLRLVLDHQVDSALLQSCVEQTWKELLTSQRGMVRKRIEQLREEPLPVKRLLGNRLQRTGDLIFSAT